MANKINFGEVLDELKRQREALDSAIRTIEQIAGGEVLVTGNQPAARGSIGSKVESDSFFGLSILDATKKYLVMMKKPQRAAAIAKALEQGGLIHQSHDFTNTVSTTLRRADNRDGVAQNRDKKWGLSEWYGGRTKSTKAKGKRGDAEPSDASDVADAPIDFVAASGNGQPS